MKGLIKNAVLSAIRQYQRTGGSQRHFATSCNFTPTCSQYTYQAIEHFGVLRGVKLGINRIRRCDDRDCINIIDDPVPMKTQQLREAKK